MNPYLRTKILTAAPEELRLMLFDGAIKFSRQAVDALGRNDFEKSYEALVRAQKIVLELSNSLDHKVEPDLCQKLTALYTYIYRRLVDANMQHDVEPVHEVIQLLEYERQTWQMLIHKVQQLREDGQDPVAEARGKLPAAAPSPAVGQTPVAAPHEDDAPVGRIGPGYARPTGTEGRPRFTAEG